MNFAFLGMFLGLVYCTLVAMSGKEEYHPPLMIIGLFWFIYAYLGMHYLKG